MNIFCHNEDPLLYQRSQSSFYQDGQNPQNVNEMYAQLYKQQILKEVQQQQGQTQQKDWVGELDRMMKGLDDTIIEKLNSNNEFVTLNAQLQSIIQNEIMSLVKFKINNMPNATDNIRKQMEIIDTTNNQIKQIEKQNLAEINDYIQNYSNLTFNEYKKFKNGETFLP